LRKAIRLNAQCATVVTAFNSIRNGKGTPRSSR
jgi:hypothetical protein